MSDKPIDLSLENDFPVRIGPVKLLDDDPESPTFGRLMPRAGLSVTARITEEEDSDTPIHETLEITCPDLGKGFYLVRFEGSVLLASEYGAIIGETRYLVVSDEDKNIRATYPVIVKHPRRAVRVS